MNQADIAPEFSAADPAVRQYSVPLKSDGVVVDVQTTPGSQFVATNLKSPALSGTYPGLQMWTLHTLEQAKGIEQYLRYAVLRAFRRDGVGDAQPMPVKFDISDRHFLVVVATPDEVQTLARTLQSAVSVAQSLAVAR